MIRYTGRPIGRADRDSVHAVAHGWAPDRPPAARCWDGIAGCWEHSDRCARCGWLRPYAMLAPVRVSAVQVVNQCRDACEGRDSQWD